MAGRKYGFRKSAPDPRDFTAPRLATTLPESVDLEPFCGPVFDQGQEGSCTANAGCGNLEYLFQKFHNQSFIFSRSFLYWQERSLDGSLDQGDAGSTGRSSCKAMNQFGVCLDSDMPYNAGDFTTAPTPEQIQAALGYKSGAYHALNNLTDIKACLASQYPALLGFTVYSSFESDQTASTGIMPVPDKSSEEVLGGHEVLIIGYDDSKQMLKVRNSWGASWGASGNFWMPYECIADSDVFMESWIAHLGPAWK